MRTLLLWLTGLSLALLSILSLIPLLETNAWWARYLDFPRLQFATGLVVLGVLFTLLGGYKGARLGVLVLAAVALGYHAWRLGPYLPITQSMDAGGADCAPGRRLSVLVANLQRDNEKVAAVLDLVRSEDADLVLLLETAADWDRALAPLDASYAHHVQSIPEEATYYGMHVYSRFPLVETEMRTPFGADTPLFVGTLVHPAGEVRVFGVHPRPPQSFEQSSAMRDATILEAALEAAESPNPALVAGDYNATPWERTSRRAMRLGGLLDPRVGRGPMISFDAHSAWIKWPLDQILWQEGLAMIDFRVLGPIGSDHYPVRADLCLGTDTVQHPADRLPGDLEEARSSIEAARAIADAAIGG